MIPDPLKEWYTDESDQQQLVAALNLPVIKKAMALLQRISIPRSDYVERSSAEAITHAAMEFKRSEGFNSYPDAMWQLTEKPAQPPVRPEGYSEDYVKQWGKEHGLWEEFETPTT